MKTFFYPRLSLDSIRKNRRMYAPYILAGGMMVMMEYILSFLMESPALSQMPGGSVLMTVLPMGCVIIALFSLLFLFYTHSFLMKQRYREFGLYNMLGMDKRNISRLLLWETLLTAAASIGCGLLFGIALSKAAELILLNLLGMEVNFTLSVSAGALIRTAVLFGGIYALLMGYALIHVRRAKPLELVQSSRVGERIPKGAWLFGLAGVALLAVAYALAVSIEEPIAALLWFFIAVLMVIVGTYLVFISGSVAFCRLLQRNRSYYYRPNHFVSVSSMVYRMKRNGAGLASICILLTMVLVMLSATTTLYFGEENALLNRYPKGMNVKLEYSDMEGVGEENLNALRAQIAPYCPEEKTPTDIRYGVVSGLFTENGITIDYANLDSAAAVDYDRIGYLYVFSLEDYNRLMQTDETLTDDECLLYCDRLTMQWNTFGTEYGNAYRVKERLTEFSEEGDTLMLTMVSAYMVVKDLRAFAEPILDLKDPTGAPLMHYEWHFSFDMPNAEEEIAAQKAIREIIVKATHADESLSSFSVHSRELQRSSFFELYGSLFFLGIMLSIVFLMAAVLMIYYKQISEGYEDQRRFEIMQKVGMTKREIRRSVNSQILTVFFLPLLLAGLHLAFAFPFLSKILLMFAFTDTRLNITVTLACFAGFGLLYAVVYKMTSGAYYAIVSGGKEA